MDEDTTTCVLQPSCVPDNPTNKDAKKMAKSVQNPDLKVANEGAGLRHLNSDEKTQPLVALSKIGARLEREVQSPLNAQIPVTLTQMQVSIEQMQISIEQMEVSLERIENNQKEILVEVMNTKARKANKKALNKYREDPTKTDDSTALKKLRTCANVVHIDFPETIGELMNLNVVRLRILNTAYRFCSPNITDEPTLYLFFSQFIQLNE